MLEFLKGIFRARQNYSAESFPNLGDSPIERDSLAAHQRAEAFEHMVAAVVDYAIFRLDPRGYIISWNAGAERIKGYKAEEIIGQHFSRFYPESAIAADWPAR